MAGKIPRQGGSFDEAVANGRGLLGSHPELALEQARTLLKIEADPRALRLAAAAHRKLGQQVEGEAAELAAIKQSLAISRLHEAARLQHEGRSSEASALAAAQLHDEPEDLLAMTISAEAAASLRHHAEAEKLLRFVHERAPSFLRATMVLVNVMVLQSRPAAAKNILSQLFSSKPNNETALMTAAKVAMETRDYDQAAAYYERLLGPNSDDVALWISYAETLRFLGKSSDSELAFRRALAIDPASGSAWWGIADLRIDHVTPADIARVSALLEEYRTDPEQAGHYHFVLGLANDRARQHDEAFGHFAEGNRLQASVQSYDPADLRQEVDQTIKLLDARLVKRRAEQVSAVPSAIFLVGMPRSGSTLIERVLGGHSRIEGAGELPIIPRMAESLGIRSDGPKSYRQNLAKLSEGELRRLGAHYLERSCDYRRTDKPLFIDKLHMNWRHLGLIHLILPGAKIIDVRRDALDCCWSNFKLLFSVGHPAANDLAHIGQFYSEYVRLMDHVDQIAPGLVLRVRYEDVLNDIEGQARRIYAFLGEDYEPNSLDFHLSQDPVATASSEQVRRPLNRDGLGAHKPYAKWLGPLRDALGPLADA